ncbi:MAG: GerW family sporulation protein [Blautia sp.]|nr:GerW family sporulation protein [Blautia sp.]
MANGNDFRETVASLFKGIDSFVAAKSVVGEPIHIGDTIIIPLADVSFGVGAGAFGKENKNDGGGVGGRMSPCAVLVIQNGITKVVTIREQDGLTKVLDLVPDIVNRFAPGGTETE